MLSMLQRYFVIASAAKQSRAVARDGLDCRGVSPRAMTTKANAVVPSATFGGNSHVRT